MHRSFAAVAVIAVVLSSQSPVWAKHGNHSNDGTCRGKHCAAGPDPIAAATSVATPVPQPTASPSSDTCPTTLELRPEPGELDVGWMGLGHNQPLLVGGTLSFGAACNSATPPCGACTLSGPIPNAAADAGAINNQRCANDTSHRCASDADCPGSTCAFFFGAPVPLSAGGVSTCVVHRIAGAINGVVDLDTGNAAAVINLSAQVAIGGEIATPCPRCVGDGLANDGDAKGFCDAGARQGLECDIGGRSPIPSFGATSLDCPPSPAGVAGTVPLVWDLTTGTTTRTLTAASPDCSGAGPAAKCFCPAAGQVTRPNSCIDDTSIGGDGSSCVSVGNDEGICPDGPFDTVCSIESFRGCLNDFDCPFPSDFCVGRARSCYLDNGLIGGSVSASGRTDPFAADYTAHPTFAALFCVPPVSATAVNVANGLPGVGRLLLPATFAPPGSGLGVCGNGILDPGEACDPAGVPCVTGQACGFDCSCGVPTCESGERTLTLTTAFGGDLDYGWTGIAHNQAVPTGAVIASRLTGCGANPGDDCSIAGDGLEGTPFLSPLPLSAGGVPTCLVNTIREPVRGTYDCATGCGERDVNLRADVFLVQDVAQPCPLCVGDFVPNDQVKQGTCTGGKTPEAACDASGSGPFGTTSNDCLPTGSSVAELDIDLAPLTTGTASLSASVDCVNPSFPSGSCHCSGQVNANACFSGTCPASGVCEDGPIQGVCSNASFQPCRPGTGTEDCEDVFAGSGSCIDAPQPCFGDTIERSGQCGSAFSVLVSTFCFPATRAAAINTTAGLPGPAAMVLPVTTDGCLCEGGPPSNTPPDCSNASASSVSVWPANHKWQDVHVEGVTDADGDPVSMTITGITQDEPTNGRGDGNTCPDADGVGTSVARVRAERIAAKREGGDGRVYHVSFVADDGRGGQCEGTANVCVPHDRGQGGTCGDQGPLVDSAGACGTTGGGSTVVRFTANATTGLQGFQVQVSYPTAKGSFTGSGGAVNCSTTSSGLFVGNDRDDGTLIMLLANTTNLSFPLDITCTFDETAGQTLASSDIGVTVVEVVENGAPGDPSSLQVDVSLP